MAGSVLILIKFPIRVWGDGGLTFAYGADLQYDAASFKLGREQGIERGREREMLL